MGPRGPVRAEWGRVGQVRAEWGWAGGWDLGSLRLGPGYKDRPSGAAFGPSGGRVGPVWGVSGVGHALGVRLGPGPGYKDRPSGAAWGRRAECGVGHALGFP